MDMKTRVSVVARCPSGPLKVEPWEGQSEDGPFVVLRVLSNDRGRLWLMFEPDVWEDLKHLVDEKLNKKK